MSDSDDSLPDQVIELIEGEDAQWIKRIRSAGFLSCTELMALIFLSVENPEDPTRDQKKIVGPWKTLINEAIKQEEITPLDHDSHTPINMKEARGWNWSLHVWDARDFFDRHQKSIAFTFWEILDHFFKANFPDEAEDTSGNAEPDKKEMDAIAELRIENSRLRSELGGLKKKLDSAGEIITGFAISKYNFDPSAEKNMALSKMLADLEAAHFPQDQKTISQFLKRKSPPKN